MVDVINLIDEILDAHRYDHRDIQYGDILKIKNVILKNGIPGMINKTGTQVFTEFDNIDEYRPNGVFLKL